MYYSKLSDDGRYIAISGALRQIGFGFYYSNGTSVTGKGLTHFINIDFLFWSVEMWF